jgi:hypothetical protein
MAPKPAPRPKPVVGLPPEPDPAAQVRRCRRASGLGWRPRESSRHGRVPGTPPPPPPPPPLATCSRADRRVTHPPAAAAGPARAAALLHVVAAGAEPGAAGGGAGRARHPRGAGGARRGQGAVRQVGGPRGAAGIPAGGRCCGAASPRARAAARCHSCFLLRRPPARREMFLRLDPSSELFQSISAALAAHEAAGGATEAFRSAAACWGALAAAA